MIKNLLLVLSITIILITYLRILITYLTTKKKHIEDLTGFDLAKEITSNYNEINIVESKEITLSKYNLKRKVIKLTPKTYNNTDLFSLSISSLIASYSTIAKDKYISLLTKVFKNIDYINKTSILAIIISILTNTIGDAKIGLILLIIILFYQYLLIQINTTANQELQIQLPKIIKNKNDYNEINKINSIFLSSHTILFVVNLILIIREITIILEL